MRCENSGEAPTTINKTHDAVGSEERSETCSGFTAQHNNNDISNEQIFNWTTTVKRNTGCEGAILPILYNPHHVNKIVEEKGGVKRMENHYAKTLHSCLLVVFLLQREENSVKRLESLSV